MNDAALVETEGSVRVRRLMVTLLTAAPSSVRMAYRVSDPYVVLAGGPTTRASSGWYENLGNTSFFRQLPNVKSEVKSQGVAIAPAASTTIIDYFKLDASTVPRVEIPLMWTLRPQACLQLWALDAGAFDIAATVDLEPMHATKSPTF